MKNKYRIIPFLLVLIAFGCQTEEITSPALDDAVTEIEGVSAQYDFDVKVKNDMLSFATRADYDAAIEYLGPLNSDEFAKWEESLGFTSMRMTYSEDELDKRGIYDMMLATLINPDAMIEIAGNIFVLSTKDETVKVINSEQFSGKSSLTNKSAQTFSVFDNVLDILEGNDVKMDQTTLRRYCRKSKWSVDTSLSGQTLNGKVYYQNSGFLHTLGAGWKKQSSGGTIQLSIETTNGVRNFWQNKKHTGEIPRWGRYGNNRDYDYRPYRASRRLKNYYLSMKFFAYDEGSGRQTSIFTRYTRCSR